MARQLCSEAARQQGSQGARQSGSGAVRQQGSRAARQSGSDAVRQAVKQTGSLAVRQPSKEANRQLGSQAAGSRHSGRRAVRADRPGRRPGGQVVIQPDSQADRQICSHAATQHIVRQSCNEASCYSLQAAAEVISPNSQHFQSALTVSYGRQAGSFLMVSSTFLVMCSLHKDSPCRHGKERLSIPTKLATIFHSFVYSSPCRLSELQILVPHNSPPIPQSAIQKLSFLSQQFQYSL